MVDLNVNGSTVLQPHDDVSVFGKKDNIRKAFEATASSESGPMAAHPESAAEFIRQEDEAAGAPVSANAPKAAASPASAPRAQTPAPAGASENRNGRKESVVEEAFDRAKDDIKRTVGEMEERRQQKAHDPARAEVKAVRAEKIKKDETKLAAAIVDGAEKGKQAIERGSEKLEKRLAQSLEKSVARKEKADEQASEHEDDKS